MGTVLTLNTSISPHVLKGVAGNKIDLGVGNLTGEDTATYLPTPIYADATPVRPIGEQISQVVGLVPLGTCDDEECRSFNERLYINTVLGDLTETDPYYNDTSTFLISFSGWYSLTYTTTIVLQEYAGGSWGNVATLNNNDYGTLIPYNTYTNFPQYSGYVIAWRKVLNLQGEGIFRIKFTIVGGYLDMCAVSEAFCLKEWTCEHAKNTVKFEMTLNGGVIGSTTNPAVLFNLCEITHTDSIRFEGFFGYEKANYERKNIEYNNGIIYKVRDEVIKIMELQTGRLPKWLHDRFKAYALMADTLLVSDYNYNNPDYSIKRKGVVCDGGYEPERVQYSRLAKVRVQFKESQQNLIRKRCCTGKRE